MGTAGLERCLVSGYRREPAPPPRMIDSTVLDRGSSFFSCYTWPDGVTLTASRGSACRVTNTHSVAVSN